MFFLALEYKTLVLSRTARSLCIIILIKENGMFATRRHQCNIFIIHIKRYECYKINFKADFS